MTDPSEAPDPERLAARRELLLRSVAHTARVLVGGPWAGGFDEVARILGEATGVSRVYLFERRPEVGGRFVLKQTFEWSAPGIRSEIDNPELQHLDLEAAGGGPVLEALLDGRPWATTVAEVEDPRLIELLASQDIRSVAVLPVFVEGACWGFIGMDDCVEPREWTEGELDVLQAVGVLLGAAVERERSLLALRRSESRLAAAVTEGIDGFLVLDGDGRILEANPAARRMIGLGEGAPIPSIAEIFPGLAQHVAAGARTVRGLQVRGQRRDGSAFEAEITLSELELDDRPLLAVTVRDVTERIALEAEVRQAQRLDSVGRLAGGMAHDFNNLLTVIQSNVELVLMGLPEGSELADELVEARSAAARGARLIQQLLTFARRQLVQPERIPVNEVVKEFASLIRRVLGDTVDLGLELGTAVTSIEIDRGQLEQVLMNLAINARDAMPTGGTLTLATRMARGRREAGVIPLPAVLIEVSDTGHGIPPELQLQVFEPFFSTKPSGQGVGLGLSTVYGIVKQAGGEITVDSQVDLGTTFRLCFPEALDAGSASEGDVAVL